MFSLSQWNKETFAIEMLLRKSNNKAKLLIRVNDNIYVNTL